MVLYHSNRNVTDILGNDHMTQGADGLTAAATVKLQSLLMLAKPGKVDGRALRSVLC